MILWYSVWSLVGQHGSHGFHGNETVFFHAKLFGFSSFLYVQEELFFISCLDILCVSVCFLVWLHAHGRGRAVWDAIQCSLLELH